MSILSKKNFVSLIKVLVAVGLIYWLVQSGKLQLSSLQEVLLSPFLVVLLILTVLNLVLTGLRWHLLLTSMGVRQSFIETLKLGLVGLFFNYAMPGGVGGDLVKGYYIVRANPLKRTASATSILLDRIIGIASMAFMAIVALVSVPNLLNGDWRLQSILFSLSGLFLGFVFLIAFSSSSRALKWVYQNNFCQKLNFKGLIFKILDACHLIASKPLFLLKTFLLSLLAQSCFILFTYMACEFILGVPISWQAVFFSVPLSMIVSAAPIAPAGIGVGQAALYSFFELMGVSSPAAGSTVMTLIQILLFVCGIFGGYYYVKRGEYQPTEKASA